MPTELNRIRELSGLQQEAPASGDQALANELSMYFAKLAKEMLQNMQRPNTNDLEYEEFVNIAQAFKGGIQAGLDEVNTSDFEFSSNPFGDFGRSINDGPDEELVKILAKYGYRPGPDGDNDKATIVKQQEESAVQEAPAANRDDLEKAYMLAVRHHEGSGDDEGTGDGNYSEDVGDLLMDYYEKTGKKPDHEQIERISNKINADEEHYADILNAESINGKIWLELAKKHYGVMMKIKEPITYPESAVSEAPGAEINNSTMSNELNRIRELSGLQQEAAVSLKGKESALKAWYNKYSKYTGGNGDPLPFGLIKAYTESGIISDGYEENELAKAEKALGKKEGDWEDQDWQKVYSMTPITQGMEKDLLTATGSKTVDEELLAKVYDVIEDMYPSYDQVLGKKESAVAEAPASGDQALAKDLANHFMKKANSFKSRGDTGPEYEEMVDIAKAFQQGQDQGMEEINDLANFEFSAHPFGGKFSNNEGEPEDEVLAILNKHGYSFTEKSHPERPNRGLVTLIKKDANTSKISQLAAQPVNSSVDDTIQRARAQIETLESALKEDYKKFQGMKPYKPKKK